MFCNKKQSGCNQKITFLPSEVGGMIFKLQHYMMQAEKLKWAAAAILYS